MRDALGDHRTAIGVVMAIDNVLLLLLVPWAGAASDRAAARGRGRLPIVLSGFVLAAAGMAMFPWSAVGGYRPLFLIMATYTTLAFAAVLFIPRGTGEAGTGPDSTPRAGSRG